MDIDLKAVRTSKNIPAKDMISIVQKLYPKFDKTMQSKCENGSAYGICLRPDAAAAVADAFAPELKDKPRRSRKNDGHRLTCRISCRLEDDVYAKLHQNIKTDGYETMQDWLTAVVERYNRGKENMTQ